MEFNKALLKQIDKFLPEQYQNDAALIPFIESVSRLYTTYEKDKHMSEHAFLISEKEYQIVLSDLHEKNTIANDSVERIGKLIKSLSKNNEENELTVGNDLSSIIPFLENRIIETKQLEELLIIAKDKAEEIALAKSNFLSMMSHEIRTPLNAIIGSIHLLSESGKEFSDNSYVKALKISSDNLLNLVNDVLDFSKIEEGRIVFEKKEVNLRKLLHDIKTSNMYKAIEFENNIEVLTDKSIPDYIIADETRLSQILNNLISNAIKFTKNGMIKINTSIINQTGSHIELMFSIIDTGIGIEEKQIESIFERFTQADSKINRKFGGSGLGLTIVRKLLQLQGSEINVKSVVGLGSRFYFTLTFEISKRKKDTTIILDDLVKDLKGIKILLAEDNEINILIAKKMLTKWNAIVDVAPNGEIAVEKFKNNQYDIILMDLQMPIMDGLAASSIIRSLGGDLPIYALTASSISEVDEGVKYSGMNGFISKPFNPDQLFNVIKIATNID